MIIEPPGESWFLRRRTLQCAHFRVVFTGDLVIKVPRREFVADRLWQQVTWVNELAQQIRGVNPCWWYQDMLIEHHAGTSLPIAPHYKYPDHVARHIESERKRIVKQISAKGFVVQDTGVNRNWCYNESTGDVTFVDLVQLKPKGKRGREADTQLQRDRWERRKRLRRAQRKGA